MQSINPWIGLDSYREGQILYGRSREIRDLSMAVFYNRQTVVYGRSGIGKSSLLHAGIFPEARLRGCLPISIRFDHSSGVPYRQQLIRTVTAAMEAAGGTLQDIISDNTEPQSLWEFYHRYQPLAADGSPLTPLIVVDQFEEIFTLSHNSQEVKGFFDELADLLNDVMPDYLQPKAAEKATETSGSLFDSIAFSMPQQRYIAEPSYHLVLVLREDYLCFLERYSQKIPALKQNRYSLLPINYEQALEVIMQPRPGLVSREVADAIIRHMVTDEEITAETPVDAAILSLFLSRLYQKKGDNPVINLQLVKEQGDALLKDFYAEVVAPLDRTTVYGLENILINADGHRENVTLETLYKNPWCKREVVETLERNHLLRLFSYGDVQRVEFAHDVLCPIIVHRKEQRENEARYRRSQMRSLTAYFIIFVLFFAVIFTIAYISDWVDNIKKERTRLFEMETSMVTRASQKMLDEHDIYGAIRLLINSMPEDLENVSSATIEKEKLLRQAVDSLMYSEDRTVAKFPWVNREDIISRNEELYAHDTYTGVDVYDLNTGALVQSFSFKAENSEPVYYYSDNKNGSRFKLGRSHSIRLLDMGGVLPTILLAVDDTTLLECFIRESWNIHTKSAGGDHGKTRMAFMFHDEIMDAQYNESGDSIAVLLVDSTTYLFAAENGRELKSDSMEALAIIHDGQTMRKKYIQPIPAKTGGFSYKMCIGDKLYDKGYLIDNRTYEYNDPDFLELKIMTNEEELVLRRWIDSLPASNLISKFRNSYYLSQEEYDRFFKDDTVEVATIKFPFAVTKNRKRLFFVLPKLISDSPMSELPLELYGCYLESGECFFQKELPIKYGELKSLYFTDNERNIVVEGVDEYIILFPTPSLPDLIEDCKAMFFDWQMSDEERYEIYSKTNEDIMRYILI